MQKQRQGLLMPSGRLGYFDVPKCASTSLKMALHQAEFNLSFDDRQCSINRGGRQDVHKFFNKNYRGDVSLAKHRIIVVRDPVARFLSAYANRVIDHNALSEAKLNGAELGDDVIFNPGLGQFLENLDIYLKVAAIEWHLRPLSAQLPNGLDSFTRVYRIDRVQELESDLAKIYKQAVGLPRKQTAGQSVSIKQLSSGQLEQIIEFCREDYDLLDSWFSLDDVWSSWKSAQVPHRHYSSARRFETTVTMSRTPPRMLITGLTGKRVLFVDPEAGHPEPRFRSLLEDTLSKEGVSLMRVGVAERASCGDAEVEAKASSGEVSEYPHSLPWWRECSYLRKVFDGEKPDFVHCRGLRAAVISLLALIGLKSNAVLSVELLPRTVSDSRLHRRIVEKSRLTLVRLMNAIRPVGLLYWLASELQFRAYYNYRDRSRWTALCMPLLNEERVHLQTIDRGSHGVVLFNASSLLIDEVAKSAALLLGLVERLKANDSFRCLKLMMPDNPDVERAFLNAGVAPALDGEKIEAIHDVVDSHALAVTSQVVVIPSLISKAARSFAVGTMHTGRPLVAPDDVRGRYLVKQGSSGYLFTWDNTDDGVLGVEKLITTIGLPEKMGFKARMTTELGFTHAAAIEAMVAHFSALLSHKRRK